MLPGSEYAYAILMTIGALSLSVVCGLITMIITHALLHRKEEFFFEERKCEFTILWAAFLSGFIFVVYALFDKILLLWSI